MTTAIILAGGSGRRMSTEKTKQKMEVCGKTILWHSVFAFDSCPVIDKIIVVYREGELDFAKKECSEFSKVCGFVSGGDTRFDSARRGFSLVDDALGGVVMIHDAARCLITGAEIEAVAYAARRFGAATASCRMVDTVKLVDENSVIRSTVPRNDLRIMQTPQAFDVALYKKAISSICIDAALITDDNMLLESIGVMPVCVETERTNIKITTRSDIDLAELIMKNRYGEIK